MVTETAVGTVYHATERCREVCMIGQVCTRVSLGGGEAGFEEIEEGWGKPNRAWFLIHGFAVDPSDRQHHNNMYFPS